jgi:hypothetical protein
MNTARSIRAAGVVALSPLAILVLATQRAGTVEA